MILYTYFCEVRNYLDSYCDNFQWNIPQLSLCSAISPSRISLMHLCLNRSHTLSVSSLTFNFYHIYPNLCHSLLFFTYSLSSHMQHSIVIEVNNKWGDLNCISETLSLKIKINIVSILTSIQVDYSGKSELL